MGSRPAAPRELGSGADGRRDGGGGVGCEGNERASRDFEMVMASAGARNKETCCLPQGGASWAGDDMWVALHRFAACVADGPLQCRAADAELGPVRRCSSTARWDGPAAAAVCVCVCVWVLHVEAGGGRMQDGEAGAPARLFLCTHFGVLACAASAPPHAGLPACMHACTCSIASISACMCLHGSNWGAADSAAPQSCWRVRGERLSGCCCVVLQECEGFSVAATDRHPQAGDA